MSKTKMSNKEMILTITCAGLCIALSYVLSSLKLFEMPMGGSVTPASRLPLVVFAMAFGPMWGFIAAFVYSVLQAIQGAEWFVSIFQMCLDYIIGFTAFGIAGFAALPSEKRMAIKNPLNRFKAAGFIRALIFTVVAYAVQWFASVLAGVIFYAEYAPEGMNAWVYSMTYNGAFLVVDLLICLAVMAVLYGVLGGFKKQK